VEAKPREMPKELGPRKAKQTTGKTNAAGKALFLPVTTF